MGEIHSSGLAPGPLPTLPRSKIWGRGVRLRYQLELGWLGGKETPHLLEKHGGQTPWLCDPLASHRLQVSVWDS